MAKQLSFDLPCRTALGREDFFVSPANAIVVGMIEGWAAWPNRKLILAGPTGSGKTHLAGVWAALAKAQIITADALPSADIPSLASGNVAVENAENVAGTASLEQTLFHLHNMVLAEGHSLLLTTRQEPGQWGLHLPDLASRMRGTTLVSVDMPDDDLLAAVLMKLFADRQLSPTPETIPYLTRRMSRSFDTARKVVNCLDDMAMETGHPINRALARQVLDKMSN